jgi:hypothetical protein
MRNPMDRSQRLTDGTRWRTFMRLLPLDDLITSYTNARPEAGLLVVDLDLGTASGLLASRCSAAAGGELEQIQFLLGHMSVQTTERYLGCAQRIASAVNDKIGIEPAP